MFGMRVLAGGIRRGSHCCEGHIQISMGRMEDGNVAEKCARAVDIPNFEQGAILPSLEQLACLIQEERDASWNVINLTMHW